MTAEDKLESWKAQFTSSTLIGGRKNISSVINSFEDEILSSKSFPWVCLQFILYLLSTPGASSVPGAHQFISIIYQDMDSLPDPMRRDLMNAAKRGFSGFEDEKFCLTVCDLVARKYGIEEASDFFLSVINSASQKGRYAIRVGLDTLSKRKGE
jgi:hypothetical protein